MLFAVVVSFSFWIFAMRARFLFLMHNHLVIGIFFAAMVTIGKTL
jgi:hypothetical protein